MLKQWVSAAVIVIGLGLSWFAVAITFANAAATQAPELALRMWPGHALAQTQLSERIIRQNPSPAQIEAAGAHAAAALRRDPTLAAAARNLGLRAGLSSEQRARQLLNYSSQMSRRDIPTQLWLLEWHVRQNDIEGALHYYGVVLQVSPPMREPLYQVLVGALHARYLVRPIAQLAAAGDSWRDGFQTYVVGHATDPTDAAAFFIAMRRLGQPTPANLIELLVPRLLAQNKVEAAAQVYRLVDPHWQRNDVNAQLDGGFDRPSQVAPFGWALAPNAAARTNRAGAEANAALLVSLPATGTIEGARKLLLVHSGPLRIEGSYGFDQPEAGATLNIALRCGNGMPADEIALSLRGEGHFTGLLHPASCEQQWMSLKLERAGGDGPANVWIDDLRLSRAN